MNKIFVWFILCGACLFSGCALFEAAAGVTKDKNGNVIVDPAGGVAGAVLNYILPGAGALIAAAATFYARNANKEKKEAEQANVATFRGIEDYEDPELKKHLAKYHEMARVKNFVDTVLLKDGINPPQVAPAGG